MAETTKAITISPGWADLAEGWLRNRDGRHCHWCAHIKHDDGHSFCGNTKSKFSDGDRIRSWDGLDCAEQCGVFELDAWYADDANIERYFGDALEKANAGEKGSG